MSAPAPASPAQCGADGRWLCNAAADCGQPAVIQWAAAAATDSDPDRTVPVFACATHAPA